LRSQALREAAVPDRRKHRGPGPEDPDWFGGDTLPGLKAAVTDLSWLLSRGYAGPSALKIVGDRYRLVERQRAAVSRAACPAAALADRTVRRVEPEALRGRPLRVDGFNLLLTLESALGGGVVLDRRVAETQPALALAARWLKAWGVGSCTWFLDAPVSKSGRLAALIRAADPSWFAEVVPDPDAILR
jgi:hypothetical protein